ncbi:MAG: TonB-dependent receptor plug [Bryobacterales bacterium]|nr:TonB-dependent receptor plug [Bryobacterales bacterium]
MPVAASVAIMSRVRHALPAFLTLTALLQAQVPLSGTLRGHVLDPQGLPVEKAKLSLVSKGGRVATETDSGPAGAFEFSRTIPGHYTLSVMKVGFGTSVLDDVEVALNETTTVDLALRLGQTSETVTVTEGAHIVETDRSSIFGRVDERRVRELPLNGENFAKLVLLAPGIAGGSPNNPSVSGARPVANSFSIDGVSANDERGSNGLSLGGGGAAEFNAFSPNLVSTESVQEFSITTSNADAAFGRGSGGQVNIITKSGSNEFHGSAYEYFRNNKLDARDFFNTGPFFSKDNPKSSIVPPFKQNLFGGTIGGPIARNKHFFFGNYEGFRQKLEQTSSATVPNADLIRQIPGEMGGLFRIFYIDRGIVPSTGNPAGAFSALSAADRTGATNGGFPAALFNGNVADGEAGTVLLSTANTRDVKQDAFLIRTDHKLTQKLDMNVRYSFAQPLATTNQRAIAGVFSESRRRWQSGVVQFVYVPRPNHIVEVRAGLLRSAIKDAPRDPLEKALLDFGVDPLAGMSVRANSTALSVLTVPATTGLIDNETIPETSAMHTWSRGKLTLRSGLSVKRLNINNLLLSNVSAFQLSGIVGPNGLIGASPSQPEPVVTELNTTVYGTNGGPTSALRGWRSTEQEYFGQADYRLRPNITINLGLRYSIFGPYSEVNGYMGNLYAVDSAGKTVPNVSAFKYGPQANAVSGISSSVPLFASDFNNLQPRVGAAWDVRGKGRTVLRAAWGMYTDRYFQRLFDFGVLNPPYAKSALLTFFPFPKGGQIPLNTGLPPQGRFVDPGLHNPTTYRYSGALEQRIFSNTSVTVSYVGLRATGLFRWQEPNGLGSVPQAARPDPRFARYRYTDNSGDSVYNSFQTFARHRFSKGIDFTVSYAYGRSVDTYSQDVGDNSQRNFAPGLAQFSSLINLSGSPASGFQGNAASWVPRPLLAERGDSDFDVRHNLSVSHVIELPVGKGRRFGSSMPSVLEKILGGYSVAGVASIHSGLPVYLSQGTDYGDVGITTSPRPALLKGSINDLYAGSEFDKTQFYLPKASADQFLGIPANVTDPYAVTRRNALHAPPIRVYDFSVLKKFEITEEVNLGFSANFFNVLNHAVLGPPIAVQTDARFGKVTSTLNGTTPRQIQLSLRLGF